MTLVLMMKGRVAGRIRLSGSWCLLARSNPRVPRGGWKYHRRFQQTSKTPFHANFLQSASIWLTGTAGGVGGGREETWSCYLTKKNRCGGYVLGLIIAETYLSVAGKLIFLQRRKFLKYSYAYWTVHHLDIWIKVDQLDDTCFIIDMITQV